MLGSTAAVPIATDGRSFARGDEKKVTTRLEHRGVAYPVPETADVTRDIGNMVGYAFAESVANRKDFGHARRSTSRLHRILQTHNGYNRCKM